MALKWTFWDKVAYLSKGYVTTASGKECFLFVFFLASHEFEDGSHGIMELDIVVLELWKVSDELR